MQGGAIVYIALFFSFIIGLIFGVAGAFISRRVLFNRQMRVAERKAAKMVTEARNESKNILQDAILSHLMRQDLQAEYTTMRLKQVPLPWSKRWCCRSNHR